MVDLENHKQLHHDQATLTHADMMGFNIDYRDPSDEVFDPEGLSPVGDEADPLDPNEQAALTSAFSDFFDSTSEVSPAAAFRAGWLARAAFSNDRV